MSRARLLLLAACLLAAASAAAVEPEHGCVVDPDSAPATRPELKDATPLAEGEWIGEVYVLPYEYQDSYHRYTGGGLENWAARQWVAQSFFEHNPDAYDFVAVVTDFHFDAGWSAGGDPVHGLYWPVQNDVAGIGVGFFDHSQDFGSRRLQGYIDANDLELVISDEGEFNEQLFLALLSHELGHRWLAYCHFQDQQGQPSGGLLGLDDSHWSYLLDSNASYMYGARWQDNGDGSYTIAEKKARYSPLDLYLMGMLDPTEVPPFTLLVNPSVPPDQLPTIGDTIQASPTEIGIDQVIAAEGPRSPAADEAPHELRVALVYLVEPGSQIGASELQMLEQARWQWQRRFFAQTDGRGLLGVGLNSLPAVSPDTLDLAAAVDWLAAAANSPWQDSATTMVRDTAAAVTALHAYGGHADAIAAGLDALAAATGGATELEAWRAEPLAAHQHPDAAALLDALASWVLEDGAWGGGLRYAGDPVTTGRAARALAVGGMTLAAGEAWSWLVEHQNTDGGWPWRAGGPSAVGPTLEAVAAATTLDPLLWNDPTVQSAVSWLLGERSQGGFGDPFPDVPMTALFLQAAAGQPLSTEVVNQAISFLASRQRSDGSWEGSVFKTAMAVAALAPYVQPDLVVSPAELVVEPEQPYVDDQLELLAAVRAANADVPAGVGYRWELVDAIGVVAMLDGVLPPIPETLFVTVADAWDLSGVVQPGSYTLRFTADPDGEVSEPDESNNAAEVSITFRDHPAGVDLLLRPHEISLSPDVILELPQPLTVVGTVRNAGTDDAVGAAIALVDSDTSLTLGATTVTVLGGGEASFQISAQLDEARLYRLAVIADPDGLLGDVDPSNNRVDLEIGAASLRDPAVVPGSFTVSPDTGVEAGDLLSLSAEIRNRGTLPVSELQVGISYAAGDPPVITPIQLLTLGGEMPPGEARDVDLEWRPPVADPAMRLILEVDPSGLVEDANRDNNSAEITLTVAPSSRPNLSVSEADIAFDPEPALQHQGVHIEATVHNSSDNPAGAFVVRLWVDEIGTGVPVGETPVAGLGPGETTVVAGDWTVDEISDRLVWADVDADSQVDEFDEGDNQAFRVLDVLTLPDLVLTSGQVSIEPQFPVSGDTVHFEVTVANSGDQPASDVEVELTLADGGVIDSATAPLIAGGGSATVGLDWLTTGFEGEVALAITADPADTVTELDEENNAVRLAVAVQLADLWVTERYISPDGDGVQDETTIYARAGITELSVLDEDRRPVRFLTLDGGVSVVWDGRNDDGVAVLDGVYTVEADGLATWVEVDNDLSAITSDVTQPLLPADPPHQFVDGRFEVTYPSPVAGELLLIERYTDPVLGLVKKLFRYNGHEVVEVGDWPTELRFWQASGFGDSVIAWTGGGMHYTYHLVQYPGPTVTEFVPPADCRPRPASVSPDGEWLLLSCPSTRFCRQRISDPQDLQCLPPGSPKDTPIYQPFAVVPTRWSPDGSRYLASAGDTFEILHFEDPMWLEEIPSEWVDMGDCSPPGYYSLGPQASVDWMRDRLTFICPINGRIAMYDLADGSLLADRAIPNDLDPYPGRPRLDFEYYSATLSSDGRAINYTNDFILQKEGHRGQNTKYIFEDLYSILLDWRHGIAAAQPRWTQGATQTGLGYWSTGDKFMEPPRDVGSLFTASTNLTAAISAHPLFGNAGISVSILAVDRNLDHYRLEYAPASDPTAFSAIGQPRREPLWGETWGTWLPPEAGSYLLRLTAEDRAGNVLTDTEWVSWNGQHDIAGLWTELRHISPVASPGVQDELVWHYTVLRPANLPFEIVDATGATVRRIPVAASQPGERTTTWDGNDESGNPVPDGEYSLVLRGAEWPVIVDNRPPTLEIEIGDDELVGCDQPILATVVTPKPQRVADANLDRDFFETRRTGTAEWLPLRELPGRDDWREPPPERPMLVAAEWWAERDLRLVAEDLAGNRAVAERTHHQERLALRISEPECRSSVDDPCRFPDRPDVNDVRDQGGLLDEPVGVLWPYYSTLLVHSTVWGDWAGTLRLEFRTPESGGLPPGEWQPGELTKADRPVLRIPDEVDPSGQSCRRGIGTLSGSLLAVYWEHEALPLRPYELRLVATNRDGDDIVSPTMLLSPVTALTVEYLRSDADGDHFRIHNLGTVRIDDIALQASSDAHSWSHVGSVGALDPGRSVQLSTGCALLGTGLGWVRAVGEDPLGATQESPPLRFERGGPPAAESRPSFSLQPADCMAGQGPAQGMMGYTTNAQGQTVTCSTSWDCDYGWYGSGRLIDLQMTVPDTDPNGTPIVGYELLIDGNVVAGAPDLVPGTTGRVVLDLVALPEGSFTVGERYLFPPGEQGMLASCTQSTVLHLDRSAELAITAPSDDEVLCPDQGDYQIQIDFDGPWRTDYLIDGSPSSSTISVPALDPGAHLLEVMARDRAGNAGCDSVGFITEDVAAITDLAIEPRLFSPVNTTGRPTEAAISFTSTATADYTVEIRDQAGTLVQTATGSVDAGDEVSYAWDGRDLGGGLVFDGTYRLWIQLVSLCGATYELEEPLPEIEVDMAPPTLLVTYPPFFGEVGAALEARGLIEDQNFGQWTATVFTDFPPGGTGTVIATGDTGTGTTNDVILQWSTEGQQPGLYSLHMEALDEAGNQSLQLVAFLVQPRSLIRSFSVDPLFFSPNGDGAADTTELRFQLHQDALISLWSEDVVLLLDSEFYPAGAHTVVWDGADDLGSAVPDGQLPFLLTAEAASGPPVEESELLSVVIDTVPPAVSIQEPADGALLGLPVTVRGSTSDLHPDAWTVTLGLPGGGVLELGSGSGDLSGGQAFTVDGVPDGQYSVTVQATDFAANQSALEHAFEIDATAPTARITAPASGSVIDPVAQPLVFRGTVTAGHPQSYAWWIADGADPDPADFTLVFEEPIAVAGTVEYQWPGSPPADGVHTLRLDILDQLGRSAEDRVVFTLDSAPPVVAITAPADGATVMEPLAIEVEVEDDHLAHWTLEESSATGTRLLTAGTTAVAGAVHAWDPLPEDGGYQLLLRASDTAGHESEVTIAVTVAVTPPGQPQGLTAQAQNQRDVVLSWQPGSGPTPAGYHVERDGLRITTAPTTDTTYTDPQLNEGVFGYRVVAVGVYGRESDPSEAVSVVVNYIPPVVSLLSPPDGSQIGGEISIWGTAFAEHDFAFWELAVRPVGGAWTTIDSSTAPILGGQLAAWLTYGGAWPDGDHELRLAAEDTFANRAEAAVVITLDNTAPDPGPANLQATLVALDPDGLENDIQLSWFFDPVPADFAGFYLYRNGLLANAPGVVIGDPSPYLLTGTDYDDSDLPDGSYSYVVTAADVAGNESAASNSAGPITIDVRRPHALITAPADGSQFEGSVEVIAECEDEDLVSLFLQYRALGAADWIDLAPVFSSPPFAAIFEPADPGLYELRALAADAVGPDPAPEAITVEAADLPPDPPPQLTAVSDGDTVTLTWVSPPGDDLQGFAVYRDGARINVDLVPAGTVMYTDDGLADGSYDYEVTAVDLADNEGPPSEAATASIFAPYWSWTPPVTTADAAILEGAGAHEFGSVETLRIAGGGAPELLATTVADEEGGFQASDLPLVDGLNELTAVSTDDLGNRSRLAMPLVMVSHQPPAPAADLEAAVSGSDVTLSWTSPADPESAGFVVERDGAAINESIAGVPYDPVLHDLNASSGDPALWTLVVDGDPATGWAPATVPTPSTAEWWSWTWADAFEIQAAAVTWSAADPPVTFELDVLADGRWLWWSTHAWSGNPTFDLPVGVAAEGIRIRLHESGSCGGSSCLPLLAEIEVTRVDRSTGSSYLDAGLADGAYEYRVSHRNQWGQVSMPALATAVVGLAEPVPPTALSASPLECTGLELAWQPGGSQPGSLLGYRVYRGAAAGGPHSYLAEVQPTLLSHTDFEAPLGTTWYYVVRAVVGYGDTVVESASSNEASATVSCGTPPRPVIQQPTMAGQPIQTWRTRVDVSGTAVPGSTVTMLRNGSAAGSTTSEFGWIADIQAIPGHGDNGRARIIFDVTGSKSAYTINIGTPQSPVFRAVVRDLGAGTETAMDGWEWTSDAALSADASHVTYVVDDAVAGHDGAVFVRRLSDGSETMIAAGPNASIPTFSADGLSVAFLRGGSELVVYDLVQGLETDVLPVAGAAAVLGLSPDGRWIALVVDEVLYLADLSSDTVTDIHVGLLRVWISPTPFSPDGSRLIFSDWGNWPWPPGVAGVWSYDLNTGAREHLIDDFQEGGAIYLDSNTFAHFHDSPAGSGMDLLRRSLIDGSEEMMLENATPLGHARWLQRTTTGDVLVPVWYELLRPELGGGWLVNDVHLELGWNTIVARQEIGGTVEDSLPIEVELYNNEIPDVVALSMTVTPEVAVGGQAVVAEGTMTLLSAIGYGDSFDVALEVEGPDGLTTEAHRSSLYLDPGEQATVRHVWDTTGLEGDFEWRLVVDPDNELVEIDETNNTASADAFVRTAGGLELTAVLDRPVYVIGQELTADIVFLSADPPEDYLLETRLEDSGGALVGTLDSRALDGFGWSSERFTVSHPLVDLYPGLYRVHATASVNGAIVAEALAPFRLDEPYFVRATVATDRSSYSSGEPVLVSGRITNLGATPLDRLSVTLSVVRSADGLEVGRAIQGNLGVAAGDTAEVVWTWDSAGAEPGDYRAELVVADQSGVVLATATPFPFVLSSESLRLAAEIELSATPVEPGDPVVATATVFNNGSVDLPALDLVLRLIDPDGVQVVEQHVENAALPAGASHSFDRSLSTDGLELRLYLVHISAEGVHENQPFDLLLASAVLEVADLSPPDVTVLAPADGAGVCSVVEIEAEVVDALTAVREVYYRIDQEPQSRPLHLLRPDLDPDLYGATWRLPPDFGGAHQITVFAGDAAGNTSDGDTVTVEADTLPPVLTINAPADGACVAGAVTISYSAVDNGGLASLWATLDGQPFTSGDTVADEGDHVLVVGAEDLCGHSAVESRSFTIDATAPEITATGVVDGGEVPVGTVLSWSVSDLHLVSAEATLDGVPIGSPVTLDQPGPHQLHVIGADCAGNTAELTVSFTVVESLLDLVGEIVISPAVLEPGQDLSVTATITNHAEPLPGVQIALDVIRVATSEVVASHVEVLDFGAGQTHVIEHLFETDTWELGGYELRMTASGLFHGEPFQLGLAAAALSVADLTPPAVTVTSPAPGVVCDSPLLTAEASDLLTGVSSVSVSVDGGAPIPLTNVGGSTWTVALSLDEGPHSLAVTAEDGAGNVSPAAVVDIELDTLPPELSVDAPADGACEDQSVTITFSANDPGLQSLDATLNGAPIASGHTVTDDGSYQLVVTAEDSCGHSTSEQRDFVVDTADPEITVSGVADGETHVVGVPVSWDASDPNLTASSATLDGQPVDPSFVVATLGDHLLVVTASDCAGNSAERQIQFVTVLVEDGLAGTVAADPLVVEPPQPLATEGIANNLVATPYTAVLLRLEVVEPVSGVVVEFTELTVDLAPGGSYQLDHDFPTDTLPLGPYRLRLTAAGEVYGAAFDVELAGLDFSAADLTPPAVTVTAPAPGVVCESPQLTAEVSDLLTGVSSVTVSVDGGAPIPLTNVGGSTWTVALSLDEGPHSLAVTAEDGAGNVSPAAVVDIELDTLPPELTVTAPADGACEDAAVTITFSANDPGLQSLEATLNGTPISSGHTVTDDGSYQLAVTAEDSCGHSSSEQRDFVVDTADPEITVSGVADGETHVVGVPVSWDAADPNLTASSATLDGQPVDPSFVVATLGDHLLVVTASDCAGNSAERQIQFVTVLVEDGLAGTVAADPLVVEPPQPLATEGIANNLVATPYTAVLLRLEVVEPVSGVVVEFTELTVDLAPGGSYQLDHDFPTDTLPLGAYRLRLTAAGEVYGAAFDVELAGLDFSAADLSAPLLTVLAPAPGLACEAVEVVADVSDNLTGVSSVQVSVDGGAPIPLANVGGSTWTVALSLDEGPHSLAVVAEDGAGNATSPAIVDLDLDTLPPELTLTAPDDGACLAEIVTISFSAEDPHLDQVSATLNGLPIDTGHVIDLDGSYALVVTATDDCGHETADERSFIVDTAAPEIAITGVADGETHVVGLTITWSATDPNLAESSATLDGQPVAATFTVDTVGSHLLVVTASDCAGNTADQQVAFSTVLPEDGISGTVAADPAQVEPPAPLAASSTVTSLVATPYPGLELRLEIVEPATGAVIDSAATTVDLPPGGSQAFDHGFATDQLELGPYQLRLVGSGEVHGTAFSTELAATTFEVVDRTAPEVTVLAPQPGLACEQVEVRAEVTDALAGVDEVRVHVDGDPTGVALVHLGGDLWAIGLELEEGPHQLAVVAIDAVGNAAAPVEVPIELDLSEPELSVEAPADGACVSDTVTITFTADDDHLQSVEATLNGAPISSGHSITDDGYYRLLVTAEDECGRTTSDDRSFTIDSESPEITVTGVADGATYSTSVTGSWSAEDPNLVDAHATLDGLPVAQTFTVDEPGEHLLEIEALDCADNAAALSLSFTVVEDQGAGLTVDPITDSSGGSVLLLDRSPGGGEALEEWLDERVGHVVRVERGCELVIELRRGLYDAVVLYAPQGAAPVDVSGCVGPPSCDALALELSAMAYRRGGILLLGEGAGADDCLWSGLAAAGVHFEDRLLPVVEPAPSTDILVPPPSLELVDLRPLALDSAFPLLLSGEGGSPLCDGLSSLALAWTPPVGAGPWSVAVRALTPHEALDSEAGELDDGDALDAASHPWVDLAVARSGAVLEIDLRSVRRGALPYWMAVEVEVAADGGQPVEALVWLPVECGIEAGQVIDGLEVTGVEAVGHEADQEVAASARRYGRSEAVALPWDPVAAGNGDGLALVEQALAFVMPTEPWPSVTGLPVPVSVGVQSSASALRRLRIEAEAPRRRLIEVWDAPISFEPVVWELELAPGADAVRTLWLMPEEDAAELEVPYTVSVADGDDWIEIAAGVASVSPELATRDLALAELEAAVADCADGVSDPEILSILDGLLAVAAAVGEADDDPAGAAIAVRQLVTGFAASEAEQLPCIADLRRRLAELVVMWEVEWYETGRAPQ